MQPHKVVVVVVLGGMIFVAIAAAALFVGRRRFRVGATATSRIARIKTAMILRLAAAGEHHPLVPFLHQTTLRGRGETARFAAAGAAAFLDARTRSTTTRTLVLLLVLERGRAGRPRGGRALVVVAAARVQIPGRRPDAFHGAAIFYSISGRKNGCGCSSLALSIDRLHSGPLYE